MHTHSSNSHRLYGSTTKLWNHLISHKKTRMKKLLAVIFFLQSAEFGAEIMLGIHGNFSTIENTNSNLNTLTAGIVKSPTLYCTLTTKSLLLTEPSASTKNQLVAWCNINHFYMNLKWKVVRNGKDQHTQYTVVSATFCNFVYSTTT